MNTRQFWLERLAGLQAEHSNNLINGTWINSPEVLEAAIIVAEESIAWWGVPDES